MKKFSRWYIPGILLLYVSLAGYRLFELPGEWFGDISILHEEVLDILADPGDWKYNLSAGPLYHHLVAPLAYLFGARYETYKVASVLTGLLGLLALGWAARAAFGVRTGLFAMALGGVSFWLLVWARLGSSPHIVAVGLVGITLGCVFQYLKRLDWRWLVGAGGVAALSWMAYPGIYSLPLVPVVGWGMVGVEAWRKKRRNWGMGGVGLAIVTLVGMGGFWYQIQSQPELFSSGYVGEKLFRREMSSSRTLLTVGENMMMNGLALWGKGDLSFRANVSGTAHVDIVTGTLIIGGIVGGLWSPLQRRRVGLLLLVWLILLFPSSSPSILQSEIPGIGRTIGVLVPVMMFAGLGLESLRLGLQATQPMGGQASHRLQALLIVGVLVLVVGLNVGKYFGPYVHGLPEGNQAWGRSVAEWIDSLPPEVEIKLTDCCWGEAGQPEPKGIFYVLENQVGRENIVDDYPWIDSCEDMEVGKEYAVVFNPENRELIDLFRECLGEGEWVEVRDELGHEVFVGVLVAH